MTAPASQSAVLDVAAIGIGPMNLALAALADEVPELRFEAYDAKPAFDWHPGLMFDWASLQVSFLADLVSLVRPTSRWSFLSYLVERDRMYPFYIAERFHIPRREYADYCAWVASSLPSCRFGVSIGSVSWNGELWTLTGSDGVTRRARNVVLGVGTTPALPDVLAGVDGVCHSGEYLLRDLSGARQVAVVGSGQSGAEVFLDLVRRQRDAGWAVTWLTRTPSFAPLDYSKLVLEYTTPEYMRYFHALPPARRDKLVASQWQLYKGIDTETIDAIHVELYDHLLDGDRPPVRLLPGVTVSSATPGVTVSSAAPGVTLGCEHRDTGQRFDVHADAVVAATGYLARRPDLLEPVADLIDWDPRGRYQIEVDHRIRTHCGGGLYVQNAELHTHGAAAPDLGIAAYRSA
ncbi:MAG: lysine N(6)-hydroxylase/L-ornithine N(5)-oxygenase family protein, partial [Micromonosporaceae bacterium]